MSLVIGFSVRDGVLMCSDTQYTGAGKVFQQKLFPINFGGEPYIFGFSGHENNAKMAIDECQDAIEDLAAEKRTIKGIRNALRLTVKPICDEYVLSRPLNERNDVEFELLVGCWLPYGGGHKLFSVGRNGAVNRHDGHYVCIGTGGYIGDYLIPQSFGPKMSMESAMLLAAHALRAAKSYDPHVGGPCTFISIDDKGKSAVVPYDFYHADILLSHYEMFTRSLMFLITSTVIDDSVLDHRLREFTETIKSMRETWTQITTAYQNAVNAGITQE